MESLLKGSNAAVVMPYFINLKLFTWCLGTVFQIGIAFQTWRNQMCILIFPSPSLISKCLKARVWSIELRKEASWQGAVLMDTVYRTLLQSGAWHNLQAPGMDHYRNAQRGAASLVSQLCGAGGVCICTFFG